MGISNDMPDPLYIMTAPFDEITYARSVKDQIITNLAPERDVSLINSPKKRYSGPRLPVNPACLGHSNYNQAV